MLFLSLSLLICTMGIKRSGFIFIFILFRKRDKSIGKHCALCMKSIHAGKWGAERICPGTQLRVTSETRSKSALPHPCTFYFLSHLTTSPSCLGHKAISIISNWKCSLSNSPSFTMEIRNRKRKHRGLWPQGFWTRTKFGVCGFEINLCDIGQLLLAAELQISHV